MICNNAVSRRHFLANSVLGAALAASAGVTGSLFAKAKPRLLRLGGPTFEKFDGPDSWVKALKKLGRA